MPLIAQSTGYTQLAELYPLIAPHVPECPIPLIRAALIRALREFFSDSRCWRQTRITLLTTVQGQSAYQLAAPENGELLQVQSAWDGLTEVEAGVPGDDDDWSPDDTSTTWTIAVSADASNLELTPTPSTDGVVIKGSMSYTLSENASAFPDWVYREYKKGLAMGAAADLVLQPQKPWSNPQNYLLLRGDFEAAVRAASNLAGPTRRKAIRSKPW